MSERVLMFEARGEPCGQPRPRFAGRGRKPVSTLRGSKAALWREAVARACRELYVAGWPCAARSERAIWGPVTVEMFFAFHHAPKRETLYHQPHVSKPDADNLAKLVLDVMQAEKLIDDDKNVVKLTVHKFWDSYSGVQVNVRPATPLAPVATPLDVEGLGSGGKPEWLQ